jgi:hypothetical protein
MRKVFWSLAATLTVTGLFALNKNENQSAVGHHAVTKTVVSCPNGDTWQTSIVVYPDADRPEFTWSVQTDNVSWGPDKVAISSEPFVKTVNVPNTKLSYTFTGVAKWSNGASNSFTDQVYKRDNCGEETTTTSVLETTTTTTPIVTTTTSTVIDTTTTTSEPVVTTTTIPDTTTTFEISTVTSERVLPKTN